MSLTFGKYGQTTILLQENVTIELNFGQTNGEGVGIEWIRSVADLAEVKGK